MQFMIVERREDMGTRQSVGKNKFEGDSDLAFSQAAVVIIFPSLVQHFSPKAELSAPRTRARFDVRDCHVW